MPLMELGTAGPVHMVHEYKPRGSARAVMFGPHARDDEVLIAGPAGTGKSRGCIEKLHLMCQLNPGMRALMVRKTLVSLTTSGLVTFREHVANEAIRMGVTRWFGGNSAEPAGYRYQNGSFLAVGGMDKPDKVMSTEYDVIYCQEATELTIKDWENLSTRLRNGKVSFQQLLADCNPSHPTHWLRQRCDKGDTYMINSRHEDNPRLFNEDGTRTEEGVRYLHRLDRLTGVRKLRLRDGLWVAAEGLIYEGFDPSFHLRDPYAGKHGPPPAWPRYWSVDFGYTNPFVLQFWAEDPDGCLILYREIYHTRQLVEDHAEVVARAVMKQPAKNDDGTWHGEWLEPRPVQVVCDHDAEGRATLEKALGLSTVPAHKAVTEGIEAVQARFKPADNGKPRLLLVRNCVVKRDVELVENLKPCSTLEELPGYVWDEDPESGKPPKEEPVKQDDHGMDAMRYLVAARDLGGRPGIRFMDTDGDDW